jgi:ATP-dependent Clp protease ATP-binding subunit ClpC
MEAKFSPRAKDVITYSREEAVRIGNEYVSAEHLLLGLIRLDEGAGIRILKEFLTDFEDIKKELESMLKKTAVRMITNQNIPLLKQTENIIKQAYLEAKQFKSPIIGTEHLLLTILRNEDAPACKVLNQYGIMYENAKDEFEALKDESDLPRAEFPSSSEEEENFSAQRKPTDPKSKTPVLDNFGRDLTKMAEVGKLDPIVGREKEIERVSQILISKEKEQSNSYW